MTDQCTIATGRMPCGHCVHDLCADCDRCCTCQCARAGQEA